MRKFHLIFITICFIETHIFAQSDTIILKIENPDQNRLINLSVALNEYEISSSFVLKIVGWGKFDSLYLSPSDYFNSEYNSALNCLYINSLVADSLIVKFNLDVRVFSFLESEPINRIILHFDNHIFGLPDSKELVVDTLQLNSPARIGFDRFSNEDVVLRILTINGDTISRTYSLADLEPPEIYISNEKNYREIYYSSFLGQRRIIIMQK
tara:strand:+ start:214 stop:846 length:633 start_codon:yes stop_codon:yes gene_type:complete